jgi:signal peptidase I
MQQEEQTTVPVEGSDSTVVVSGRKPRTGLVLLTVFVIGFVLSFALQRFMIQLDVVNGHSMEPTFHEGERVLVDRIIYRLHPIRYGDVVAIRWGANGFMKRVVGLPGDHIVIQEGKVFRNGVSLKESYTNSDTKGTFGPFTVPQNCVFLLGDNRNASRDSRSFGAVPVGQITGRVDVVWWPLQSFQVHPFF